ncbi:GL18497 [Drosophila persimilis]|uniref:Glutathione S-transferase C-terminal domain-containing protein homolog n=1 Tax=Drosophila persimilis TaxID=7234 RepID=B4G7F8_DROPE|nr:glutathione S-transferase C-terminal domain-containing protein homolog [Drosophila persimilis]XP_026844761.1 glutathione S-transferase C-terminal domain-containing protein homolog [Drosophila persimilis]EDW29291.1 GL18497 [Drosophila persimilis]
MDQLYLEIEISTQNAETTIYTSVSSFLALYTYRYLNEPKNIQVNFVATKIESGKIALRSSQLRRELTDQHITCREAAKLPAIRDLRLPIYEKDGNTFIAGTCAVCRELIARQPNTELRKLLGFKESCLLAPSEASIWTRFCEVDVVDVVSRLHEGLLLKAVPDEVVRFEQHMNEPVRMHNIYKQAREQANQTENGAKIKRKHRVQIDGRTPKEQLLIEHRFAEGISFTIADLILYPLLRIVFQHCGQMLPHFPLTSTWFSEIDSFDGTCAKILGELYVPQAASQGEELLSIPDCDATSLYKADPKRYKPRNRIYTSQAEVDLALAKLSELQLVFSTDSEHTFGQQTIDWQKIEPTHATSSALPQERLERKRQQLENMANAVVSLAQPGDRIVDFCSGTGHLAILLALKLPLCTIIVMENKSFSLAQAQKRALELELSNCVFYQCNIDYFVGRFDIGASLHACGTATDIVLQQCRRSVAHFVCCPCCYGSLQPMPHISYPLSQRFQRVLSTNDYLYIAHTADQAHEMGTTNCKPETTLQGLQCMSIVDTDRKLQSEEAGYQVILTRLKPEQCTPKNHLLVGRFVKQN